MKRFFTLLLAFSSLFLTQTHATTYTVRATLNAANQVPSNASTATGAVTGTYDDATNMLTFSVTYTTLSGGFSAAHIHEGAAGANGGVVYAFTAGASPINGTADLSGLTAAQKTALLAGNMYVNIHSGTFGGGEIRGQLMFTIPKIYYLRGTLSGANEVPANAATATGNIMGTYSDATLMLTYNITYTGLTASPTAAHIHAGAAGASGGVLYGLSATASPLTGTVAVNITDEAALLAGNTYVNIHTAAFAGGEIRAQIAASTARYYTFQATLNGSNEVPSNASTATGTMSGTYDRSTLALTYDMTHTVSGPTAAHIHGGAAGANGGVLFNLGTPTSPVSGTTTWNIANEEALLAGNTYINIHSGTFAGGEIRSQLMFITPKIYYLRGTFSGANEVPANAATATGNIMGTYNDATRMLTYNITYTGLTANPTAAHIHAGAAGVSGGVLYSLSATASPLTGTVAINITDEAALLAGNTYVNIHTAAFAGGEIRAQIAASTARYYTLRATLNGANEVPSNASTATGTMSGTYDRSTLALTYNITHNVSGPSAAHIHGGVAGMNGGVLFNLGTPTSPISGTTTWNIANEEALLAGNTYLNIHSGTFAGGEIRSQINAAQSKLYTLTATLNGANEVPANGTAATGTMTGTYNDNSLLVTYNISHNVSGTTAAHIHEGVAGMNGGVLYNLGTPASPISGSFTLDMAKEAALLGGSLYINIHSGTFAGGEIRSQINAPTSVVLAVELVDFTAKTSSDNSVSLAWTTLSEKDNLGFEVQKSPNGRDFHKIGFVKGQGTTTKKQIYTFEDLSFSMLAYYRLKMVDAQSKETFSKTVAVQAIPTDKICPLRFYPNPIIEGGMETINIRCAAEGAAALTPHNHNATPLESELTIVNIAGKVLFSMKNPADWQTVDASKLPKGIYIIRVITPQHTVSTGRLVKL